jgi:hypothetical protein
VAADAAQDRDRDRGDGVTAAATSLGIVAFVARALGWSVILFAAWFLVPQPVSEIAGWTAARWVEAVAPVARVEHRVGERSVGFEVEADYETIRSKGMRADTLLELAANPLKYTFGVPFFLALLFASHPAGLAWKAFAGAAVLLALASIGLACDVLLQIGGLAAPGGAPLFAFAPLAREMIALGYQLGTLVFPTVAPLLAWAAMDRATVLALARR